jgi:hypothetical protein
MHEEVADKPSPDQWRKPLHHQPESFEDEETPAPWTHFLSGVMVSLAPPAGIAPEAAAG